MTANVRSMAADRKLNEQYENILREAERTDLSRAQNSNCVVIGHDIYNCPIVAFIPNMNFDYGNQSDQILHQLYLLFIKVVHPIARDGPFSIVYSRKGVDWRKPLIYEYYKLLPEKLKKNLMKIYIINPQIGVKMISSIARVFLSADFHSKLFYVQTIADFQRIVPPRKLILPAIFLGSADQDMGLKCSGVSVPLALDYLPAHRTSSIVHRCATFLRSKGCLRKTGLFRVAGNESLLSLVRVRLQPPIFYTKDQMRSFLSKIQIGVEEEEQVIDDRPSMIALQSAPVVHDIAFGYGVSTVVITDTESVAQTLKLSLRELPEPLFTFKAFDALMKTTQILDRKQCTFDVWYEEAMTVIESMPVEHKDTLCYLLDFLREVAAESVYNQMDLFNLSTIFAPTVLRPAKPDFTNAAKAFNEVRLCQLVMKHLLEVPPSKRVVGLTTLREYQPGREPEPVQESSSVKETSTTSSLVDDIASALTTTSLEASLGGKMKNRVTSFARTPKNSTGEGRTSLFSALSSIPAEDDTNYSRQLPISPTIQPKRRLSEPDTRRDSRQSFGNSISTRPSMLDTNNMSTP